MVARTYRGPTLNLLPSANQYKLVSSRSTMNNFRPSKRDHYWLYSSAQKSRKHTFLASTLTQAKFSNDHYATIKSKMAFYFKPRNPWLPRAEIFGLLKMNIFGEKFACNTVDKFTCWPYFILGAGRLCEKKSMVFAESKIIMNVSPSCNCLTLALHGEGTFLEHSENTLWPDFEYASLCVQTSKF